MTKKLSPYMAESAAKAKASLDQLDRDVALLFQHINRKVKEGIVHRLQDDVKPLPLAPRKRNKAN